jgi:Fuseless
MPVFSHLHCYKKLATHVVVGMGAASFWRGAWYVLDDNLFPNNKEASAASSLALGVVGMAASQGLVARAEQMTTLLRMGGPMVARFGAIYSVALSVVLVWRGTWVGWDCLYERYLSNEYDNNNNKSTSIIAVSAAAAKSTDPGHATTSGVLSHVVAVSLLLAAGLFTSVLAPPAAISIIRDVTVKGASTYQAPVQLLMDQFLGRGAARTMATTSVRGSPASRGRLAAASHTIAAARAPQQPYSTRFHTVAFAKLGERKLARG